MGNDLSFESRIKITCSNIIQFSQCHGYVRRVSPESAGRAATSGERPYSLFGNGSRKRLRESLSRWTDTVRYAHELLGEKKITPLKRHTFLTLTLPSPQIHCDKIITREALGSLIQKLKRKFYINNYIWKAEIQKNGNIHYHILTDKFIPHLMLRDHWNDCLQLLGYVSEFEKRWGHSAPNSTDIHALRKIRNINAYIGKYMSKSETIRPLCGHTWGRSDGIAELESFTLTETLEVFEWFQLLHDSCEYQELKGERYCLTKFTNGFNVKTLPAGPLEELKKITRANLKALHLIN
jgi:hypothetical protein